VSEEAVASKEQPMSVPLAAPSKSGLDALSKDQNVQLYWLKRLVAYVIDAAILGVVIGVLFSVIALPFRAYGVAYSLYQPISWLGFGIFPLISGAISLLYFTFMDSKHRGTFGKSLMGFKVTREDGQALGIDKAFTRNISKVYWALLLLDLVVGLATETDHRRKFSDKFSGAIVVPK